MAPSLPGQTGTRRSERLLKAKTSTKVKVVVSLIVFVAGLTIFKRSRKTIKKRKHISRPEQSANCHLLNLPAEIRNEIFRSVLVEEQPIEIDELGPGEPALLRVCKSIRTEARDMYYCENSFQFIVEDCDISSHLCFVEQYDSSAAQEKEERDISFVLDGYPDPQNITAWMMANHHSNKPPLVPKHLIALNPDLDPLETVLESAIKLSFLMSGAPCFVLAEALCAMWRVMEVTGCACWL